MSVRRLADEQPTSFEFTPENRAWAEQERAKYPAGRQASAVLALLWRAQKQNGYWLPRAAIEKVAAILDMPNIRVLEVATFYTMFNLAPVGRHYVQVCGTTPCMLSGSDDIKSVCRSRIGEQGHVTPDGQFSWIEVECLGACCNAPMVQINDDYYEDLTSESFAKLLEDLATGRPVKRGSQIGRESSEPVGGLTALAMLYGADGRGSLEGSLPANDQPPATLDETTAEVHAEAEAAHINATLATLPGDATAQQKADAVGARPLAIEAPRGDAPDDLQRIKGVGPINEKRLHELGIFHFEQIAVWVRSEIRWVGTYLSFPGRIDREQWVAQAAKLAAGGSGPKDEETHTHLPTGKIGN
jgi:NADH-quinone oxidoreductase subunit E